MGRNYFSDLANKRLQELGWTPYRLAQELEGRVTKPTVYSFLEGKPVKTDTLIVIMEGLGMEVRAAIVPNFRPRKEAK